MVEGSGQLGGIPGERSQVRTQSRVAWRNRLARVNKAARRDRKTGFTALLHHVTPEALERSFRRLRRQAAAGVDGVSPLLGNVFLHYVLDLWVHQWRGRHARGRVSIVRFADDFVMGFQYRDDAERLRVALEKRLREFSLELHPQKTRLIEFGRFPALRRQRLGQRRPSTFAFLGFTHYCGWTRDGRFVCKQRTQSTRLSRKLREVKVEARRRMHRPVAEQHRWLTSVLRGHYRYYGLPGNSKALASFRNQVSQIWYRSLRRRSQRGLLWLAYNEILRRLPLLPARVDGCEKAHPVGCERSFRDGVS